MTPATEPPADRLAAAASRRPSGERLARLVAAEASFLSFLDRRLPDRNSAGDLLQTA